MHNKAECRLACQHRVRIPIADAPTPGDEAFCRRDGWQEIRRVYTEEWRVRCEDCTFGRWTGQGEKAANKLRISHESRYPRHVVAVAYDTVTPNGKGKVLVSALRKALEAASISTTTDRFDGPVPF